MIRLGDLPEDFYIEYYQQLPQIDEKKIRLLWHHSYFDGPINGILLYEGKTHWFKLFYPLRTDEIRSRTDKDGIVWNDYFVRYLVIELTEEQVREEEYWHELFRQKVGTHTDYDENGQRKISELKPENSQKEYFELSKTRNSIDLSNNLVIGWFEFLWGSIEKDEDINNYK
jgi:hypothetical protein